MKNYEVTFWLKAPGSKRLQRLLPTRLVRAETPDEALVAAKAGTGLYDGRNTFSEVREVVDKPGQAGVDYP